MAAAALAVSGVAVVGVAVANDDKPPPGVDPTATSPAALIGSWRPTYVRSFTKLDKIGRDAPTITFGDDGQWHGSDGCNGIGGTYDAGPGKLHAEAGPQTAIGCDNVPNGEVLVGSAHFRVSGTVLTLYDGNWVKLANYSRLL